MKSNGSKQRDVPSTRIRLSDGRIVTLSESESFVRQHMLGEVIELAGKKKAEPVRVLDVWTSVCPDSVGHVRRLAQ